MTQEVPVLAIVSVIERGVANDGDIGVLGVRSQDGEKVHLAMPHHLVDVMAMQLTELIGEIDQRRKQSGKDKGPIITQSRKLEGFGTILDRQTGGLMLHFVMQGGVKTTYGIDLKGIDALIELLKEGREAVLGFKPPPAT